MFAKCLEFCPFVVPLQNNAITTIADYGKIAYKIIDEEPD